MNINVINDEYFENLFLVDPDKCNLIQSLMIYEQDLWLEYRELQPKYFDFIFDKRYPDGFTDEALKYCETMNNRIHEIEHELDHFLDNTGITKEEYEAAKSRKNCKISKDQYLTKINNLNLQRQKLLFLLMQHGPDMINLVYVVSDPYYEGTWVEETYDLITALEETEELINDLNHLVLDEYWFNEYFNKTYSFSRYLY